MAEFPLEEAIRGKDVEVIWMPFELRPYPTPTLRPDGDYLQTAWRNSVYPMAARLGVEIRLPAVSPQPYTRLAFEGLEFAKDHGHANDYNSRVMRAFFVESLDIGNADVLSSLAKDAGLDDVEFREALQGGHYRERVGGLLRHASEEMRITGVPLFAIGRARLTGLQPAHALEVAIDAESAA